MKVRTLKRHGNSYAPQYVKNPGRIYVLPEREAENLIAAGLVVKNEREAASDETDSED